MEGPRVIGLTVQKSYNFIPDGGGVGGQRQVAWERLMLAGRQDWTSRLFPSTRHGWAGGRRFRRSTSGCVDTELGQFQVSQVREQRRRRRCLGLRQILRLVTFASVRKGRWWWWRHGSVRQFRHGHVFESLRWNAHLDKGNCTKQATKKRNII